MHVVGGFAELVEPFAGDRLRHGDRLLRSRLVVLQLPHRFVRGPAGAISVVHHIDEVVLHSLEARDGLAELDAPLCVVERELIDPPRGARDVGAEKSGGDVQRGRQGFPTPVNFADDVL